VVELVDTLDLGSSVARRGGSSPLTRTKYSERSLSRVRGTRVRQTRLILGVGISRMESLLQHKVKIGRPEL
jgi:hypothetical protein